MASNEAPETETFCLDTQVPEEIPVIRFIGGIALEPQIDPTKGGGAGPCGLTQDLVGPIQAMLAPFQPVLTILDVVATLGQCFLLMTEVITNPFKIPKLLGCIPGLVNKINTLLSLVPIFPQGIQAFITFVVDIIRFIAVQIDCVVAVLTTLEGLYAQIQQLQQQLQETDDPELQDALQKLLDCSQEEADQQVSLSLNVLGPIARLLCTVRAILALVPGGAEIQKNLAFPDPTDITALEDAIEILSAVRDALLAVEDALVALTGGLGVLPPPPPGFQCPLDDLEDDPTVPEPSQPSITGLFNQNGTPLVFPAIPASAPHTVRLTGDDLYPSDAEPTLSNKVFFNTSPIPPEDFISFDNEALVFSLSEELLQNAGEYLVTVVNQRQGGAASSAFSGLDGSSVGGDDQTSDGVAVSEPLQITVS